tara:strand:- start:1091 stop:1645 length:555 start_codon:yes stop_codon:yes gene_type:complete
VRHDPFYPESSEEITKIAKERKFIPKDIFTDVRQWTCTPTADFIPVRYGPRGYEFLLAKRNEAPWCGEWFFPGGRIVPGETPEEGMIRGCQRELGFAPDTGAAQHLLWQSIYNPECAHGGKGYFTMSGCWQVWVKADVEITIDCTQSEFRWFTPEEALDTVFPIYVKNVIKCLRRDPSRDYFGE